MTKPTLSWDTQLLLEGSVLATSAQHTHGLEWTSTSTLTQTQSMPRAQLASPPLAMSSMSSKREFSPIQLSSRQEKRRFDYWQSIMPDLDPPTLGDTEVSRRRRGRELRLGKVDLVFMIGTSLDKVSE